MFLTSYVADELWLCGYPVRLAGTKFEARMTVIRLASGEIMLHSPCRAYHRGPRRGHPGTRPGGPHRRCLETFTTCTRPRRRRPFRTPTTWILPWDREAKQPDLTHDGILGDVAPADWTGELDQVVVRGTRIMREVAMYHRASRTLKILVDLIENFTDATPNIGGALEDFLVRVRAAHVGGYKAASRAGIPARVEATATRRRGRFDASWRGTSAKSCCPMATLSTTTRTRSRPQPGLEFWRGRAPRSARRINNEIASKTAWVLEPHPRKARLRCHGGPS